ncbi:Kinesin heavy chain [Toensbergia leucococca]|nr:Kinesin heavy chain [Toensbergia leucococca]
MGSDIDDDVSRGIIPRIVEQIFASILRSPGNIEYTVRVSYMEIYMERIRDLLAPQNDNLPIHEEKARGVYVKGLLEIYVSSVQEVYEVMRRGGAARATAATNMNLESSRSHSIFVITITQKNVETGSAKSGQLFLVDLAGSEKVGKTGASGQTLEEAKKINKSLSALGMVINSLTDGKSTHIPYRDSKLTRILQESLGGNSRTTLIINCSPSSYNDAETISTLRFGVRAKAIKNKAKINAELSPVELKQLLKKAQTQVTTYEAYVSSLEGEVQLWRSGDSVPKERWAPPLMNGGVNGVRAESRLQRPGTPSRLQTDFGRSETPSRSESRTGDRSSTPSIMLDKDEREEYLRRENELQDQIAEKESQVASAEKGLKDAKDDLQYLKEHNNRAGRDNERLNGEIHELKMQLERINFEGKEASITMDGLKEANSELTVELDEVKQQLLDFRMSAKETGAILDEKEKKKTERMAQMMASFDLAGEGFSENEKNMRACIDHIEALHAASVTGETIALAELGDLKTKLLETQSTVRQAEMALNARVPLDDNQSRRKEALEERLAAVESDYEEILVRNLSEADVDEIKSRLETAYVNKREDQVEVVKDLRDDIGRKADENQRLHLSIEDLQRQLRAHSTNGVSSPTLSRTVQQQIADFDVMKKSLMRDLQNRCERVVELEISLDETREQYNNVLRSSNNRAQQKKMAFLERNLEQLTHVQRQLVEQNGSLKKEVAIAERKLIARNERILSLEGLLQDSQDKLTAANHRYLDEPLSQYIIAQQLTLLVRRFEAQLAAVKERLEAAKLGSTRGLSSPSISSGLGFGGAGSRIAKPLRGGGSDYVSEGGSAIPVLGGAQTQEANGGGGGKRSTWFFDRRS